MFPCNHAFTSRKPNAITNPAKRAQKVARKMRQAAPDFELFGDPRHLAYYLGFNLAVGDEASTATLVVYPWDRDEKVRGTSIYLALAKGWLLRTGGDLRLADELAHALAIPIEVLDQPGGTELVYALQPHFEGWRVLAYAERDDVRRPIPPCRMNTQPMAFAAASTAAN